MINIPYRAGRGRQGGSSTGNSDLEGGGEVSVTVQSFSGVLEVVRVGKRPGMEKAQLLYDSQEEGKERGSGGSEEGKSVWEAISR